MFYYTHFFEESQKVKYFSSLLHRLLNLFCNNLKVHVLFLIEVIYFWELIEKLSYHLYKPAYFISSWWRVHQYIQILSLKISFINLEIITVMLIFSAAYIVPWINAELLSFKRSKFFTLFKARSKLPNFTILSFI